MIPSKKLLRPDEVGGLLGLSKRTINRYLHDGTLASLKPGNGGQGPRRISREALSQILGDKMEGYGDRLLKPKQVAENLAVSPSTVYSWIDKGKVRAVKIGSWSVRIWESSVQELLAEGEKL